MTALKSEWIMRPKKVNAFTGVSALFEIVADHVCIVCANEDVLFEIITECFPKADISGIKFQKVSIIQAP